MSVCDPQLLSAYLDGELTNGVRVRVEEHIKHCPSCMLELDLLSESSALIRNNTRVKLSQIERARLHRAIRQGSDQNVWRLGLVLIGLAASVLIISSAWLMELPSQNSVTRHTSASAAPWEEVAMTWRADPLQESGDSVHLADAGFTNWMLRGLSHE